MRALALFAVLALGCSSTIGEDPTPLVAQDAALPTDAPSDAPADVPPSPPALVCGALFTAVSGEGRWQVASRDSLLTGACRNPQRHDAIVRFTAPTAGRWVFVAEGANLLNLALRTRCDANSELACVGRNAGRMPATAPPYSLVATLREGESVDAILNGCPSYTTCLWRFSTRRAPPDFGPCDRGGQCARGQVCQRLAEEAPDAEPRCMSSAAPRLDTATMMGGDGTFRYTASITDPNRDANLMTLAFLDAAMQEIEVGETRSSRRHVPLTPGQERISLSSPFEFVTGLDAVVAVRVELYDTAGNTSEPVVVPLTPMQYVPIGGFCDPSMRTSRCTPGACCWSHEGTLGVCRSSCH